MCHELKKNYFAKKHNFLSNLLPYIFIVYFLLLLISFGATFIEFFLSDMPPFYRFCTDLLVCSHALLNQNISRLNFYKDSKINAENQNSLCHLLLCDILYYGPLTSFKMFVRSVRYNICPIIKRTLIYIIGTKSVCFYTQIKERTLALLL